MVAGLRLIVGFNEEGGNPLNDVNLWSIDTGMNGNLFMMNYFDMNEDHTYGRMLKMKLDTQIGTSSGSVSEWDKLVDMKWDYREIPSYVERLMRKQDYDRQVIIRDPEYDHFI